MPSSFSALDTGFPNLNKYGNNTEAKLKAIESYLVQLLEHLRYTLNNLGAENFNEASLRQITDPLRVNVQGIYADEWKSGTSYYASDVVKISTADTVEYYKALADHTSSAANKPPSASWEKVSAPNVQSMLDIGLSGITLSYDNDRVGSGDHNASYIKLTKDGTEIAGGKVFIKDLDASTIKTGTLNAEKIVIDGEFSVIATENNQAATCGTLGGTYNNGVGGLVLNIPYYGHLDLTPDTVELYWKNGSKTGWFRFDDDESEWVCSVPGHLPKAIYFDKNAEKVEVRCDSTTLVLESETIKISRWKNGVNTVYDLFDKLGQI